MIFVILSETKNPTQRVVRNPSLRSRVNSVKDPILKYEILRNRGSG